MRHQTATRQSAQGKWDWILTTLCGPEIVRRKHGPCPMCGGKDRYRYDNKNNGGEYYCAQCGHGDGFDLLCKLNGWDFKTAANAVDDLLGNTTKEKLLEVEQKEQKPFLPIDPDKRRSALNAVWADADQPQVAIDYLAGRGLDVEKAKSMGLLGDIRGSGSLLDSDTRQRVPGMVAMIRNGSGRPIGIHRTLLPPQGVRTKKMMPPIEPIAGAGIRLGKITDKVVIGEGIETTLAACMLYNMPGLCAMFANNMERIQIPEHVRKVVICVDNDRSFTGQAASFALAKRLVTGPDKRGVTVVMPLNANDDMADYALRGGELLEQGDEP